MTPYAYIPLALLVCMALLAIIIPCRWLWELWRIGKDLDDEE